MHRSKLGVLVIDCNDLEVAAEFWSQALGTGVRFREEPYVGLEPTGEGVRVVLQRVPEPKTSKNRMHIDLWTDNLEAEVERLEGLGARRRDRMEDWWVMEDPDGNEFCVVPIESEELATGAVEWEP